MNNHHIKGIGGKPSTDYQKLIPQMTMIYKGEELPLVKVRLPRKQPKPYDLKEKVLRQQLLSVLRKLRRRGVVKYWRIENGLPGYHGIPDWFIVSLKTKWGGFVELKSDVGVISQAQNEFADLCFMCGIKHMFARSVDEVIREVV